MFEIVSTPLDIAACRDRVLDPAAGGFCSFEGWVRNHHQGREVLRLEYESFAPLARKEGQRILDEAFARFDIHAATCVHRTGSLEIGELAVVVCVSASHRDAAFDACRYIIDETKARVPVWKKEYFTDGTSDWVACERCAAGHHHHH